MQTKVLIAAALVGVVLLLSGSAAAVIGATAEKIVPQTDTFQPESVVQSGITVDVSGAVLKPGVYSLPQGSRMEEALKIAGGVSPTADTNYLAKSINLSQKITDGLKIYIPSRNELISSGGTAGAQIEANALIDINSASADQLDKLPGIGPTTSQNIISKRPYITINDLVNKKVVSKSVFAKIEKLIVAR